MTEPKPFASLSSGLLARKGAARPAMRPQGFTPSSSGLEDLGWNDMGAEAPQAEDRGADQVVDHPRANHHRTGLTPVQSPVHSQQAEIADRLNEGEEDFDEEYDETAEPYELDAPAASFSFADDADEEPEFKVQTKPAKRPLDLGPAPEAFEEPETLELDEPVVFEPAPQAAPVPVPVAAAPARRAAPAVRGKAKAAFTLRLDPERHLKLRLACAVRGRSAQQLVTDALDQLLSQMPELDDMADKAQNRG